MRLVWSQPSRIADDRPRAILLVSLLCVFLGGVVVGAGGRDLAQAPRPVRAAFAGLLATGGLLFVVGAAMLVFRKGRKPNSVRLSVARSPEEAEAETHYGQEERR